MSVLDSIGTNLTVLCQSCGTLNATSDPTSIQSHRNAYLAYVCLLAHIIDVCEAESRENAPAPTKGAGKVGELSLVWQSHQTRPCLQQATPRALS